MIFLAILDASPMELGKGETAIENVRISGEEYREEVFIKEEIQFENADFEEYSFKIKDEGTDNGYLLEEKPNIVIQSEPEIYYAHNSNCHDDQTLTNTKIEESGSEVNEPLNFVKVEEITIDETCAVNEETVEGKLQLL